MRHCLEILMILFYSCFSSCCGSFGSDIGLRLWRFENAPFSHFGSFIIFIFEPEVRSQSWVLQSYIYQ